MKYTRKVQYTIILTGDKFPIIKKAVRVESKRKAILLFPPLVGLSSVKNILK